MITHCLILFYSITDTITCLCLNPKGTHLLSNSMDGTLRSWDIRPFIDGDATSGKKKRHDKTFVGGSHNSEKGLLNCAWSADGTMVTGGSADRIVHIWDELSAEEVRDITWKRNFTIVSSHLTLAYAFSSYIFQLYVLPGHNGCVNSVIFHPKEHVIASASSDKTILVGELS
jgi:Prp8 binding protein